MELFFLFVLGLFIGSFLNVLIDRLPRDESIAKGRSYCDKCKKTLKWYDLIPVLSFILLRGKCRYCHSPISYYYPIVEIITGVFFALTYVYLINYSDLRFTNYDLQFFVTFLYYLTLISSLIIVFFTDLKYGIIPDKIIFPAAVISIIYHLSFTIYPNGQLSIINGLLSGFGAFLFFLALYLITRGRGMGFGDVKLVFLLGIFLGFPKIISALYLSFLLGAFVGLILILLKKKRFFKGETIPFGPFLVLGSIISLFLGENIIRLFIY
ncbi:MAG: prepilin peptidase [Candidatus Levybacteria bacterium]|nr:prepilin peptidase [Candidatus Levybacteria bacterium]